MKTLLTTMALAGGLFLAVAGTASAGTPAQCQAYAQAQTDATYPLGVGVLKGGLLGALGGAAVGAATGGNVGQAAGIGAVAGGGIGTVAYQNKRQNYFNSVYAQCIGSGPPPPPPTPIYAPAGPYNGTVYQTLNVRTGGGTQYPVVFVLQPGMVFQVLGCGAGWCSINVSGYGGGFASQTYIHPYAG
ncbi:MAG: SH3 domain-containing protein [Bauldia sp.]